MLFNSNKGQIFVLLRFVEGDKQFVVDDFGIKVSFHQFVGVVNFGLNSSATSLLTYELAVTEMWTDFSFHHQFVEGTLDSDVKIRGIFLFYSRYRG